MGSIKKHLLSDLVLPLGDVMNGTRVISQLNYWRQISRFSEEELNKISKRNLEVLLRHATSEVPFYNSMSGIKRTGPDLRLSDFPIMHKIDIKNNIDSLVIQDQKGLIKYSSSGSSGIQGITFMNKKEQSIIRAIMMLWWEWSGYSIGQPTLQTGMTTERGFVKSLKDLLLRIHYVQAFNLDEDFVVNELVKLRGKKNLFLAGYASSLNVYAEICLKKGIDDVKFDSAICWGDKLFDHYKKNIREAFGCDVKETYSCNEGFLVGAKKDLDYFYIMSPHVYIEIVDKDFNPVPDGTLGYVLLTRLDGFSMPLIRYYVGDLAIKLPRDKYPEKREMFFPLLERVIGRDTDLVVTPSGKKLIVHFFTGIFEFIPEIRQFMVVQKELHRIEILYVPAKGFETYVLEKLEKIFYDKVKEHLNITWRQVDTIPPTASGKPQIIQSFIGRS